MTITKQNSKLRFAPCTVCHQLSYKGICSLFNNLFFQRFTIYEWSHHKCLATVSHFSYVPIHLEIVLL